MSGLRVIICGGRDFTDETAIANAIQSIHLERPIRHVFHGNARGADTVAAQWIKRHYPAISVHACPADWKKNGRAAGPIRNENMMGHKPDLVIAFPGGRGTADMVKRAKRDGVEVIEVMPPVFLYRTLARKSGNG